MDWRSARVWSFCFLVLCPVVLGQTESEVKIKDIKDETQSERSQKSESKITFLAVENVHENSHNDSKNASKKYSDTGENVQIFQIETPILVKRQGPKTFRRERKLKPFQAQNSTHSPVTTKPEKLDKQASKQSVSVSNPTSSDSSLPEESLRIEEVRRNPKDILRKSESTRIRNGETHSANQEKFSSTQFVPSENFPKSPSQSYSDSSNARTSVPVANGGIQYVLSFTPDSSEESSRSDASSEEFGAKLRNPSSNFNGHQYSSDLLRTDISADHPRSSFPPAEAQKVTIIKEKTVHSTSSEAAQERVNIEKNPLQPTNSEIIIQNHPTFSSPQDVGNLNARHLDSSEEQIILVEGTRIPGKNYGPQDDTFGFFADSYNDDKSSSEFPNGRRVKVVKVVKTKPDNRIPPNLPLNDHGNGQSIQYFVSDQQNAHAEGGINFQSSDNQHGQGGINFQSSDNQHGQGGINFQSSDNQHGQGGINFQSSDNQHGQGGINFQSSDNQHGQGGINFQPSGNQHAEGGINFQSSGNQHADKGRDTLLLNIPEIHPNGGQSFVPSQANIDINPKQSQHVPLPQSPNSDGFPQNQFHDSNSNNKVPSSFNDGGEPIILDINPDPNELYIDQNTGQLIKFVIEDIAKDTQENTADGSFENQGQSEEVYSQRFQEPQNQKSTFLPIKNLNQPQAHDTGKASVRQNNFINPQTFSNGYGNQQHNQGGNNIQYIAVSDDDSIHLIIPSDGKGANEQQVYFIPEEQTSGQKYSNPQVIRNPNAKDDSSEYVVLCDQEGHDFSAEYQSQDLGSANYGSNTGGNNYGQVNLKSQNQFQGTGYGSSGGINHNKGTSFQAGNDGKNSGYAGNRNLQGSKFGSRLPTTNFYGNNQKSGGQFQGASYLPDQGQGLKGANFINSNNKGTTNFVSPQINTGAQGHHKGNEFPNKGTTNFVPPAINTGNQGHYKGSDVSNKGVTNLATPAINIPQGHYKGADFSKNKLTSQTPVYRENVTPAYPTFNEFPQMNVNNKGINYQVPQNKENFNQGKGGIIPSNNYNKGSGFSNQKGYNAGTNAFPENQGYVTGKNAYSNIQGSNNQGYGGGKNAFSGNQGLGNQGYGEGKNAYSGNQGPGNQGYGGGKTAYSGNQGTGNQGYGGTKSAYSGNQGSGNQGYGGGKSAYSGNQESGNQGYGGGKSAYSGNQGSGNQGYAGGKSAFSGIQELGNQGYAGGKSAFSGIQGPGNQDYGRGKNAVSGNQGLGNQGYGGGKSVFPGNQGQGYGGGKSAYAGNQGSGNQGYGGGKSAFSGNQGPGIQGYGGGKNAFSGNQGPGNQGYGGGKNAFSGNQGLGNQGYGGGKNAFSGNQGLDNQGYGGGKNVFSGNQGQNYGGGLNAYSGNQGQGYGGGKNAFTGNQGHGGGKIAAGNQGYGDGKNAHTSVSSIENNQGGLINNVKGYNAGNNAPSGNNKGTEFPAQKGYNVGTKDFSGNQGYNSAEGLFPAVQGHNKGSSGFSNQKGYNAGANAFSGIAQPQGINKGTQLSNVKGYENNAGNRNTQSYNSGGNVLNIGSYPKGQNVGGGVSNEKGYDAGSNKFPSVPNVGQGKGITVPNQKGYNAQNNAFGNDQKHNLGGNSYDLGINLKGLNVNQGITNQKGYTGNNIFSGDIPSIVNNNAPFPGPKGYSGGNDAFPKSQGYNSGEHFIESLGLKGDQGSVGFLNNKGFNIESSIFNIGKGQIPGDIFSGGINSKGSNKGSEYPGQKGYNPLSANQGYQTGGGGGNVPSKGLNKGFPRNEGYNVGNNAQPGSKGVSISESYSGGQSPKGTNKGFTAQKGFDSGSKDFSGNQAYSIESDLFSKNKGYQAGTNLFGGNSNENFKGNPIQIPQNNQYNQQKNSVSAHNTFKGTEFKQSGGNNAYGNQNLNQNPGDYGGGSAKGFSTGQQHNVGNNQYGISYASSEENPNQPNNQQYGGNQGPVQYVLVEQDVSGHKNENDQGVYLIQQGNDGYQQNVGNNQETAYFLVEDSNLQQQHPNVRVMVDGGRDKTFPIRQLATVGLHMARSVLPQIQNSKAKSIKGKISFGVEIKKGADQSGNVPHYVDKRSDTDNVKEDKKEETEKVN